MATISRLSVSLTAKTGAFRKGMRKAGALVKNFVGRIASIKGALIGALGIGGLGLLAKSSIDAFAKQEMAAASFDTSLKSMGRTTKGLSETVKTLASRIQQEGIIGDEAILEGAAFLSTYGDITDDMLPRTIRAMVDLAAKTGGSTTNAAKLLGKASMGLVGALSIAGISLSDATKKSKNFEDILTEIEAQVGGTNAALGATASGAMTQFGNALGDIKEVLGEILIVAIGPFLRLFSQELETGAINARAMGEALRDWIIDTAKSLSFLLDVASLIGNVWDIMKGTVQGVLSVIIGAAHLAATAINSIWTSIGGNAVFSEKTLADLESRMISLNKNMRQNILGGIELGAHDLDFLLETGGENIRRDSFTNEIDDLVNRAMVAEMKSRLGIAGGANFASAGTSRALQGPQVVRDPQLEVTNAGIKQMVEIMGGISGFGAVAQ